MKKTAMFTPSPMTRACRMFLTGTTAVAVSTASFAQAGNPLVLDLSLPPVSSAAADTGRVSFDHGFYAADEGKKSTSLSDIVLNPVFLVATGGALLLGLAAQSTDSGDAKPSAVGLSGAGAGNGGAGVLVGVVDTGLDASHPRVASKVVGTFNALNGSSDVSADPGHGTAVSSLITTMAPNARLAYAKGLGGSAAQAEKALNWAVSRGASVVSLSLGTSAGVSMRSAMRNAAAKDVLLVAAAGNEGAPRAMWPAKFAGEGWAQNRIIVVGALDPAGNRAYFSNWDPALAQHVVFAPGQGLSAAQAGGGETAFSGTSAATPVVAGQAALIKGTWQFLGAAQVADIIFQTADRICSDGATGAACASRGPDSVYGWGKANAEASLRPVGKLSVKASNGATLTQGPSSLDTGAPTTLAALGVVKTVAVDGYNRGFDVTVAQPGAAASNMLPAMAPAEARVGPMKFRLNLAPEGAFAQRGGAAVEFSGAGNTFAFAAGTGGAQDAFFGLESSGHAPLSLSGGPGRFNAPYFAMAENGTHAGTALQLSSSTKLRMGVVGQGAMRSAETSFAGTASRSDVRTNRQVMAVELQRTEMAGPLSRTAVLTAGQVLESNGFLGVSGSGAMATEGGANTSFLTAAFSQPLDEQTSISAMMAVGQTGSFVNKKASLLEQASATNTLAWSLGVARKDTFVQGDSLGFTVAMPLRATSGSVTLNTAVSQNSSDGSLNYERKEMSLAPSGKERRLELAYSVRLRRAGEFAMQLAYRTQPGHDANAQSQAGVGIRYNLSF